MLFFPFKVDLNFSRYPLLTIMICLLCLLIYINQEDSFDDIRSASYKFCQQEHERMFWLVVEKVYGERDTEACANIFAHIHAYKYPERRINDLTIQADTFTSRSEVSSRVIIHGMLEEKYRDFKFNVRRDLSAELMYEPHSYNLKNMITAAFAHGSWEHLMGNLFFFFAFAASIELILGLVSYVLIFIALAIGTHLAYSLSMMNIAEALPTLGLSGVVMGMIGVFVFLMPKVNIRCFIWFFFIIRVVRIPAWILAAWYVGWDVYALYVSDSQSGINFIAHVSGAMLGFGLGLLFLDEQRLRLQQELLIFQEKQLQKQEDTKK